MKIIKISAIWCSACLIMNKIYKELEKEQKLEIISYDIDMDEEEVEKYNVGEKLPEVIFLEGNKEIGRMIGEHSKEEIEKYIKELNS